MRYALAFLLITTPAVAQTVPSRQEVLSVILSRKHEVFRDPESLRGTLIGKISVHDGDIIVCFQTNAKNAYGGMTGHRMYLLGISKTTLDLTGGRFTEAECGPWIPAPELDGPKP